MKQIKQLTMHYLFSEGREYYLSYSGLYWRLKPFTQSSVRGAINGLIKMEMVDKIKRKSKPMFRLTKIGGEQYGQLINSERGVRKWDLRWRFLIVISGKMGQAKLRLLRKLLDEEGYRGLEKGVYVSPFKYKGEFKKRLIDSGFISYVRLVETRRFLIGDDRQFASQVWGLDTIYNKQNELIRRAARVLYRVRRAKRLTDQLKRDYIRVSKKWLLLQKDDPRLPKQLLPGDWPGASLASIMGKVGKSVRQLEQEGEE